MKFYFGILLLVIMIAGCSVFKNSTTGALTPVGGAVCDIESSLANGLAGSVAGTLACSNQAAIVTSLQSALGNVNLCAAPLPAPASAALKSLDASGWKTVGDVPASALKKPASVGLKAEAVKTMGIVGQIACPIAIDTGIGFLSNSIPAAWGCSASVTVQTIQSALIAACELAVPI